MQPDNAMHADALVSREGSRRMHRYILISWATFMVWNSILFASDLRLYPVQEGQIIVDQKCSGNLQVKWDRSLSEATGGLKKTDELFALSTKGSTLLSVGDPSCFIGECQGNYVAVQLVGADKEVFGAIKKTDGMSLRTVPVQVTSLNPKECTNLYPGIFDESFPKGAGRTEDAQNVSVQNFPQFTIATKGFKQENGWVVYVVHAQAQDNPERKLKSIETQTHLNQCWVLLIRRSGYRCYGKSHPAYVVRQKLP